MIIRAPNRDRYVTVAKTCLEDKTLSFKAKGLWAYLMTKPNDWVVLVAQLIRVGPDGKTSVMSAFNELEQAGYIQRLKGPSRSRTEEGTWDATTTQVFETPLRETRTGDTQGNTRSAPVRIIHGGLSTVGNPPLLNNDQLKKEDLLSHARVVKDALALIVDRRMERAEGTLTVANPRAYRRTVRADVEAEHRDDLMELVKAEPELSAEELADRFEKPYVAITFADLESEAF